MSMTVFEQDIQFNDKLTHSISTAKLILYIPQNDDTASSDAKGVANSKHLILISGGAFCGSDAYSAIGRKLAALGYVIAITKYSTPIAESLSEDFAWMVPKLQTSAFAYESSHFGAMGEALRLLMDGEIRKLENHKFTDFLVLGHSMGGANALYVSTKKPFEGMFSKLDFLSQSLKENYWYKYFAGLITFEGDTKEEVTLPEEFFWTILASTIRGIVYPNVDALKVDQFVIDEMNHFSINDYQGEKQVLPGTFPRPQEDFFKTNEKAWEEGIALMAQIIHLEIQGRLDKHEKANQDLQLIKENHRIRKFLLNC